MGKKYSKQGKARKRLSDVLRVNIAQLFNTRCRNDMFNNTAVPCGGVELDSAAILNLASFPF